ERGRDARWQRSAPPSGLGGRVEAGGGARGAARGERGPGVRERGTPAHLHARAPGARRDRLLDRARPAPLHAAGEGRRAPVGIAGPAPRARGAGDGPLMSFTATLRRHAAAHPDKTALVDDRVRLSYAE